MNKNIFIACDTKSTNKAKKIIKLTQTKKLKIGYKFGLEFVNSKNGRSFISCLLYTSPSPRDQRGTRMPSSA